MTAAPRMQHEPLGERSVPQRGGLMAGYLGFDLEELQQKYAGAQSPYN